jgi:hypothetical protein
MEPSIQRGDLLVLTNFAKSQPLVTGDIVVYKLPGRGVPIVHRIIKVHEDENGSVDILSKGDNNIPDDRGLYGPGMDWLQRDMIVGRACAFLPKAGMLTILVRETWRPCLRAYQRRRGASDMSAGLISSRCGLTNFFVNGRCLDPFGAALFPP